MIIDGKLDYKNRKLILIRTDGDYEERDPVPAYFYVFVPKGKEGVVERVIGGEEAWVEESNLIPIILKGERYEPAPDYITLKICTRSPTLIPRLSESIKQMGLRIGASNVRYIIRNTFDLDIQFFDSIPLYYGFDPQIIDRLKNVRGLIIDVEAIGGKPVLASAYLWSPFAEIRKEDIISLELPAQENDLRRLLAEAALIMGHNVIGFDLPILKRSGIDIDLMTKSIFDTSLLLSTYGSSLGVGSARSLLDVSLMLKEEAGITDEEISIKRSARGRIDRLSREDLIRYNTNDIVLTSKLLNIFYPFVASISSLTQIPTSEILTLPAGMIAEYFLLRFIELLGFAPEYRPTSVRLEGERVWNIGEGVVFYNVMQMDVKMMYPTFVLHNYIDPSLHIGNNSFDRMAGVGVLFSAVRRLATIRELTKKLKKSNPLFEPIDKGIKAILNALAYGVQGKQSGLSIMGNPWCPSKIFYGTRESQFETIEFLRKRGYRIVYSDTDSFFVSFDNKPGEEDVKKLLQDINSFLKQYGLEADLEDVWNYMFIYSKKNYTLRKSDKIVIKGSALRNLGKFYLPECVNLHELLRIDDKEERKKYIREVIETVALEDLFICGHQQIWRLISKDVQSWKRLKDRKERYMRVLTPWVEKPTIILKKARGGQLLLPHSNPIFKLFFENGREISLEELNPFNIVEFRALKIDGYLESLRGRYSLGDLIFFEDRIYTLKYKDIYYKILTSGKEKLIPMWYSGSYPPRPIGILKGLMFEAEVKAVNIDEAMLRRLLFHEVVKTLKQYKLL